MSERAAVRLIIRGRVQGVGYRWWAVKAARELGLDGWVRNRSDGSVELHAEGAREAIDGLIEAGRVGPAAASVTSIERMDVAVEGCEGFHERATI